MAAVDLCIVNHGLGIYIRILSLAGARTIDNLSAQVLKADIYRHILVDDTYAVILEKIIYK
jgi:hypothetical protein